MGPYEQYIHKSRYARYLDDKQRRENWSETVDRYIDNIVRTKIADDRAINALRCAILNQDIMPSMRAMMTAGPASERDNTCIYNCSYLPIDDTRAFDEAMFILLCGTGVGFSVEKSNIQKLPEVPRMFTKGETIVVEDSKEGWASAFRTLLQQLWAGSVPDVDYSLIRPAGARLKTFGGRASGPKPLSDLFTFSINLFAGAQGRQLTALECHDLMCKVGEVVVVGGVRRSAMISLSDFDDKEMATCKAGNWWETAPWRALANNSAVYHSKPDIGKFMREWSCIHDSFSGERGIFNRQASVKQVEKFGRRDPNWEFGTNPCSEIILRPNQFCNLTEVVVRPKDSFEDLMYKIELATILGCVQATYTKFPYLRDIWRSNTEAERLLGVSLTGIYDGQKLTPTELQDLRAYSVAVAKEWSEKLGIEMPAATTCVKPSGTVSQLVNAASGAHPRHAPFYLRRVRADNKDPLTMHMVASGIINEPDKMKPDSTTIFTFAQRAPEGCMTREDLTAEQHLADWLSLQRNFCEHKPSVTINLKDEDWMPVGAKVFEHFDEITGVSFLPYDGGSYVQAPYEECTEEVYKQVLEATPKVSFDDVVEHTDTTEGAQQLACVAGVCSI